jgi:hypothetical protein
MRNGFRAQRGERVMKNGYDSDISSEELAALYREHDRFREEQRAITEHQALTKRADEAGLVHREQQDALVTVPEPTPDGLDELPGFNDRQADAIAYVICELRREWRRDLQQLRQEYETATDRRVGTLENENCELRGLVGDALGKLDKVRETTEASCRRQQASIVELKQFEAERRAREQVETERGRYIAELRRDVASVQIKLQNTEIDAALAARDAKIEQLEMQLRMLLMHMGLMGLDPPRF